MQGVPGGVVLLVADPDGEVVADPAAGEQARQRVARRMLLQVFADRAPGGRPASCVQRLVEGAQEGHAAAGVVLPAVLAVEDDAHQGRARRRATAWPMPCRQPMKSSAAASGSLRW